jgi:hypothetical protein
MLGRCGVAASALFTPCQSADSSLAERRHPTVRLVISEWCLVPN